MARILLAEDDEIMRISVSDSLKKFGWDVDEAVDGLTARDLCRNNQYNLVVSDIRMPGMDGRELLRFILKQSPDTDVVMMTAHGSVNDAIQCLREGAAEYLLKPFDMDDLLIRVNRLLDTQAVKVKCQVLEESVLLEHSPEIIGFSPVMRHVYSIISQAAPTNATILITGESGTGEDLAARAVHLASSRREKPFVAINCAAIPEGLIESELFGHERGAFTGADRQRRGKFELADGGTLLLDELGDLPGPLQAKLLRVLQENQFERVGGNKTIQVDVRFLACTSKELDKEVEAGRFRQDLLYRLQVIPLKMPPLREREGDVKELSEFFVNKFNHLHGRSICISEEAVSCLGRYHFPGNVRELRNIIERALVLCTGTEICVEDLPSEIHQLGNQKKDDLTLSSALARTEYRCLLEALRRSGGNRTEAARSLGISRKNLWEKLKTHGIG
ncbi:MAG: sigma-54-dependent Fis family transcriptional regulator [Proteobacteria bacterium]|nr:MAG: sigma-54-dependent Fis family transcriptional regulator [Pseudomonadota bacterium]